MYALKSLGKSVLFHYDRQSSIIASQHLSVWLLLQSMHVRIVCFHACVCYDPFTSQRQLLVSAKPADAEIRLDGLWMSQDNLLV